MSEINRAKVSVKIYKQLEKKGLLKSVNILRNDVNVFNERVTDLYVCTIKAYYYKNSLKLTLQSGEASSLTSGYLDKLLVTNNDESKKIKQDDYFTLDGVKYKIIELGNVQDIVFDMSLERM
ncbi:hypothetical protein NE172_02075 [Clostridium botulinum]|uniref:Uncharacterized protein n=1 Tax=Clostridium botulinum TaxID=1491 RepID=A0A6B4JHM9_CLOBO|nr:hypothetical protein [Clostridium botulinum]EES51015.1 conserved hypothetical protein [Clostridium botulinum E1 str. 'BoNT E Beluga']MBY6759733.1 hypothetical protein [Clostridium botulinum]MBY6918642.1 hypothetical protein [Clostridium botulinum]MCR1129727.1 hypothetical protein [Clostridium botulinum]NFJ56450.1 hypothetical protein [Clostridium botulinum]